MGPSGQPCIHLISPTLYLLLSCGKHIQVSLISFNNYTQSDLLSLPLPPQDGVPAGHLCCQRDRDQTCFWGLPQVRLSSARHNWHSKCCLRSGGTVKTELRMGYPNSGTKHIYSLQETRVQNVLAPNFSFVNTLSPLQRKT